MYFVFVFVQKKMNNVFDVRLRHVVFVPQNQRKIRLLETKWKIELARIIRMEAEFY